MWDTGILTLSGLSQIPWVSKRIPDIGLNEAFMSFGAIALLYNIVGRQDQHRWLVFMTDSDLFFKLLECHQRASYEKRTAIDSSSGPRSFHRDGQPSAVLAPCTIATPHSELCRTGSFSSRLGIAVRSSGRTADLGACEQCSVPFLGLDVAMGSAFWARRERAVALQQVGAMKYPIFCRSMLILFKAPSLPDNPAIPRHRSWPYIARLLRPLRSVLHSGDMGYHGFSGHCLL